MQALGCLLYYLMYNKLAFAAEAKLQILNGDFTVSGSRPPAFVAVLRELLVTQPARRLGMCNLQVLRAGIERPYCRSSCLAVLVVLLLFAESVQEV